MLNFDDEDVYDLLLVAGRNFGVDPSMSLESEAFFRTLLTQYSGALHSASITAWLEVQIEHHFIALGERPRWIQSPEWPFVAEKPLIFAGQIDLFMGNGTITRQIYHDDTSLYVFVGKKIAPVVVLQQF